MGNDQSLELRRPLNWIPPKNWRTRLDEIDRELESNGSLADDLLDVRRKVETAGDQAGKDAAEQLAARHPDLFWGEAGLEVIWSIVSDGPIHPYRPSATIAWEIVDGLARPTAPTTRDVFHDDEPPPYNASARSGRSNKFGARKLRQQELIDKLFTLLRGTEETPPATHKQIQEKLGLNSTAFHKLLHGLRRSHRARFRSSPEQSFIHEHFLDPPAPDPIELLSGPYEWVPEHDAPAKTGLPLETLIAYYRCQRVSRKFSGDERATPYLRVPKALLPR